jgi:hypothetical protein
MWNIGLRSLVRSLFYVSPYLPLWWWFSAFGNAVFRQRLQQKSKRLSNFKHEIVMTQWKQLNVVGSLWCSQDTVCTAFWRTGAVLGRNGRLLGKLHFPNQMFTDACESPSVSESRPNPGLHSLCRRHVAAAMDSGRQTHSLSGSSLFSAQTCSHNGLFLFYSEFASSIAVKLFVLADNLDATQTRISLFSDWSTDCIITVSTLWFMCSRMIWYINKELEVSISSQRASVASYS